MSNKTKHDHTIINLIDALLATDMFHPTKVIQTNNNLNRQIYNFLRRQPTSKQKHIYIKIKSITNELAILAQAATMQNMVTRTMSNHQFIIIQKQLEKLKHQLKHKG